MDDQSVKLKAMSIYISLNLFTETTAIQTVAELIQQWWKNITEALKTIY